ncbi:hypothetical protein [Mycobacteroides abscessus]
MTTYPLWADIPSGVTVYVPNHALLAIKLENATLVSITEHEGRAGWIQTTGRLKGPFEDVYGGLVASKALSANDVRQLETQPRQWNSLEDVPHSARVRDADGDLWKCKKNGWNFKSPGDKGWIPWAPFQVRNANGSAPFTEIVK